MDRNGHQEDVSAGRQGPVYFARCGGFSSGLGEIGIVAGVVLADVPDSAGSGGMDRVLFPEPLRKRMAVAAKPSSALEPLPPVTRISGTNFARPSDRAATTFTSAVAFEPSAFTCAWKPFAR